jgi:CheY-like chemotaxis protein
VAAQEQALPDGGAAVLVVDDDPGVRSFLRESLSGLGYDTQEADSAAAALAAVEKKLPDLVLLDYAMPGMHGADAARELRARHPDLPIVFVTGYAESSQLEAALGSDVPVLRKPFTIADLAAAVRDNLAAERAH